MRKLIQKVRDYFNHRRNYRILKALVFKNAKDCDFEECFELMTLLSIFKKEGCAYRVLCDKDLNKDFLCKIYPEISLDNNKEPGAYYKKEIL